MLEEKGLNQNILEVQHDRTHFVEVEFLIELMVSTSKHEQKVIEKTMRHIDFANGDMLHYLNHLATAYVVQNF